MSAGEKLAFEKVGKVNLNREEWGIYPPRSVVFLFDLSAADPKHLNSVANTHYEDMGETWILCFSAHLVTETDESQNGWPGAVVHKGAIPVPALTDVTWQKHVPSPRNF